MYKFISVLSIAGLMLGVSYSGYLSASKVMSHESENHLYTDIEAWRETLARGPLTADMRYFIENTQTADRQSEATIENTAWLIGCMYIIGLYQDDVKYRVESDGPVNSKGWNDDFRSEPLMCLEF